jgi:hypothetical protein
VNAMAILYDLQRRGISVAADGNTLVLKPRRALDSELLARLREHKAEILRALSARPATCGATCYEVEPGRWIHHPWDGCKIPMSSREPYVPSRADCGCDGPVCPKCFLCPVHCRCQLRQVGPEAEVELKSDLGRDGVPKTLPRGRSQTTDFVDPPKSDCESPKSSDFGGLDSKHV